MHLIDRRAFIRRSAIAMGGAAAAGALPGLVSRALAEAPSQVGYGPLINRGELWLPAGFNYRIVQTTADFLSNGDLVPSKLDGMAAFPGPEGTTVLIRNHENADAVNQVPVRVPADKVYDPAARGGVVKLILSNAHEVVESYALLGGTALNCAGGVMPWRTWISCEEAFTVDGATRRHGYIFEVDPDATEPVDPVPIVAAGRFDHEAVVWHDGFLYETEDHGNEANAFYRFQPNQTPQGPGDLAANGGTLWALRVIGSPGILLRDTPQGTVYDIDWVQIPNPDPNGNGLAQGTRAQAWALGAARFWKSEGMVIAGDKIYFNGSGTAGRADGGHIWELDPVAGKLKLFFDSPSPTQMVGPDNMEVSPNSDLFVCEDSPNAPIYVRGVQMDGQVYDLVKSGVYRKEYAGACFDQTGNVMYLNGMGAPGQGLGGATYAIWGPWMRVAAPPLPSPVPMLTETPST